MSVNRFHALFLLGSLFAGGLPAQSPAPGPAQDQAAAPAVTVMRPAPAQSLTAVPKDFKLGPGGQIQIRMASSPELNEKTFRIDPEGNINAPMVGRINATGLTAQELEQEFVKRLKVMFQDPEVSITVTDYPTQPVSVFGEVTSPGVHQLVGPITLVELLSQAGGVRSSAGPTVRITRRIENGPIPLPGATTDPTGRFSVAKLELKPLTEARTPEFDIPILPNDVVSVPRAELIYIAGDVTHSGSIVLSDRSTMSILEALSATGGVTRTADTKKARILRVAPGNAMRTQVPVDLGKIMSGKVNDVELVAGDILVVPSSNMKKATQRALEAAIQAGTVIVSTGIVTGAL